MNKASWHYGADTREVWIRQRRTALAREVGGAAAVWVMENTPDGVAKTYMHISERHEGIFHVLECTIQIEVEGHEEHHICILKRIPITGTFLLNGKRWVRRSDRRPDGRIVVESEDNIVCDLSAYTEVVASPTLVLLDE